MIVAYDWTDVSTDYEFLRALNADWFVVEDRAGTLDRVRRAKRRCTERQIRAARLS